jgi:transcription elongation factor
MRVQLDVPESVMVSAIGLIALRDAVLRVTVEVSDTKPQIVRKVAPESSRDFTLVDARKKAHDGKAMGKQVPDGA